MKFLLTNWELIVGILSFVLSSVLLVIHYVRRWKAVKTSNNAADKEALINEIKSAAFGLITAAEHTFSDIPTSGASKLVYVLKNIQDLCTTKGLEYDEPYWELFVNAVIAEANAVQGEKEDEREKIEVIEKVKKLVPDFIQEANRLFVSIPDSQRYKTAYVVSMIAEACEQDFDVDVFDSFDWQGYVEELYQTKKAG